MQVVPCISQAKPSKTLPSKYTAKKNVFQGSKHFCLWQNLFSKHTEGEVWKSNTKSG